MQRASVIAFVATALALALPASAQQPQPPIRVLSDLCANALGHIPGNGDFDGALGHGCTSCHQRNLPRLGHKSSDLSRPRTLSPAPQRTYI
jgi:hypothetical protein